MNPNSGRFLSQKWVFIVFAMIAFVLAPFVPLVLAEEQTDTPETGVPAKTAKGGEHPVSAHSGFMAPTLEGPWRSRIALNGWLLNRLDYEIPIDVEVRKGSWAPSPI